MLGIGVAIGSAITYHGIAHTHLDSLAHINDNGVFYNGYAPDADAVVKDRPPEELDSQRQERHLHARHPDRHSAAEGRAVSRAGHADLRRGSRGVGEAGRREGSAGDALFVRTGVWARRKAVGPWLRGRAEGGRSAGLDPSVIPWLRARDVARARERPPAVRLARSPGRRRGAVHDFALSISACSCSTTATSRRWPTRPREASVGSFC